MNLFCFPYAGASAAVFHSWRAYLDPYINLIPVELASRGTRIHDPLYKSVDAAVEDIYQRIKHKVNDMPYAFFGHSLGSLLAYKLEHEILRDGIRPATHLFFSGKASPNIINEKAKKLHLMDEVQFKSQLLHLGGTPPEFFEHPELVELFLPLLKNDFRLAETIVWDGDLVPFECDISIFMGKQDEITAEQTDAWKHHTSGKCTIHYFNGGHFFLHQELKSVVSIINSSLTVSGFQYKI